MTKEQQAIQFYESCVARRGEDQQLDWQLRAIASIERRFTNRYPQASIAGAHFSVLRFLHHFEREDRRGGQRRFMNGVNLAFRQGLQRIIPGHQKRVQAIELDGSPSMDRTRGPLHIQFEEARNLVARWNDQARQSESDFRYRVSNVKEPKRSQGFRCVVQYRIELAPDLSGVFMSMDSLERNPFF